MMEVGLFSLLKKDNPTNCSPAKQIGILHYVCSCLPCQTGYSIRTHYIASNQLEIGYGVNVAQWVGFEPLLWEAGQKNVSSTYGEDGVQYFRPQSQLFEDSLPHRVAAFLTEKKIRGSFRFQRELQLPRYWDWLVAQTGKPDIIHAHSHHSVGREALRFAKRLKIPIVYEVRGFWRLSQVAESCNAVDISRCVAADVKLAKEVDLVVAICWGIAQRLISEGVPEEKISIVPNAVESRRFKKLDKDLSLLKKLNLEGKTVFGYVTNVRRLEGIQDFIKAWRRINKELPNAIFLLVGTGHYFHSLKKMVDEAGIEDSFLMVGSVPHREVSSYYSVIDIFVVPRIREPVCEIVTPLKPLEAMAMGIPVVASDVAALREMIEDGETGLLFKAGDIDALSRACIVIGKDKVLRKDIAAKAMNWVANERDWSKIVMRYGDVYDKII